AHLVRANCNMDIFEELERISRDVGPIAKLDYYGHGFPDSIVQLTYTEKSFHWATESLYLGKLKYGLEQPRDINQLFRNGAQIRFTSCFVGSGREGEAQLEALGLALLPEGGNIYASTLQIYPGVVDAMALKLGLDEPAPILRNIGDFITRPSLGLATLHSTYFFNSNTPLTSNVFPQKKFTAIKIDPQNRKIASELLIEGLKTKLILSKTLQKIELECEEYIRVINKDLQQFIKDYSKDGKLALGPWWSRDSLRGFYRTPNHPGTFGLAEELKKKIAKIPNATLETDNQGFKIVFNLKEDPIISPKYFKFSRTIREKYKKEMEDLEVRLSARLRHERETRGGQIDEKELNRILDIARVSA
ncbi:MAG: hypothetical protein ACKOA8_16280, partial [Deltaproteobacteria bacterium]